MQNADEAVIARLRSPCSPKPGFTLLELLVVLTIIGISFGLVGILVSRGAGSFELKRFAKNVSVTLRYARNQAVSEKRTFSFVVHEDERAFSLYADGASDGSGEGPEPVISKEIPEDLFLKVYKGVEDDQRIDFFSQGNSTGGDIEVKDQKGHSFLIKVNRITGKVEVKKGEDRE
jgi:prepilin-type N-terminal cleavage/methylation domain-containing protein